MRLFAPLAALAAAAAAVIPLPPLPQRGPSLVPAPPRQEIAESPPPPATPTAHPQLNRQDVEAWLDGYMPYALQRGKINLDADINTYLPKDFRIPPRNGKAVTMRHILTHTPGFEEQIKNLLA